MCPLAVWEVSIGMIGICGANICAKNPGVQ